MTTREGESSSPHLWERRAAWVRQATHKTLAVTVMSFTVSTVIQGGPNTLEATLRGVLENPTQTHSTVHDDLEDLHVVLIDQPDSENDTDIAPDKITQAFHAASGALERTTDGELAFPSQIPIYRVEELATGTRVNPETNREEACLSDGDIAVARKRVLGRVGVPSDVRTAIVIEDAPACFSTELVDKGSKLTVQARSTTGIMGNIQTEYVASAINPATILHEEGHAQDGDGLDHSSEMVCETPTRGVIAAIERRGRTDIGELIKTGECDVARSADGDPNMYADTRSVMGDSEKAFSGGGDVYNFLEINQIAPRASVMQEVDVNSGEYQLGLKPEQLRGITFELPNDHPLRKIDPTIHTLSVGVDPYKDTDVSIVRLIANGDDAHYVLRHASYVPGAGNEIDPVTLYTDKTLGIQIVTSSVPDGAETMMRDQVRIAVQSLQ